jgi:hypothetical protein
MTAEARWMSIFCFQHRQNILLYMAIKNLGQGDVKHLFEVLPEPFLWGTFQVYEHKVVDLVGAILIQLQQLLSGQGQTVVSHHHVQVLDTLYLLDKYVVCLKADGLGNAIIRLTEIHHGDALGSLSATNEVFNDGLLSAFVDEVVKDEEDLAIKILVVADGWHSAVLKDLNVFWLKFAPKKVVEWLIRTLDTQYNQPKRVLHSVDEFQRQSGFATATAANDEDASGDVDAVVIVAGVVVFGFEGGGHDPVVVFDAVYELFGTVFLLRWHDDLNFIK